MIQLYNVSSKKVNKVSIVKVTIPKGYSNNQIGQALQKAGLVT